MIARGGASRVITEKTQCFASISWDIVGHFRSVLLCILLIFKGKRILPRVRAAFFRGIRRYEHERSKIYK